MDVLSPFISVFCLNITDSCFTRASLLHCMHTVQGSAHLYTVRSSQSLSSALSGFCTSLFSSFARLFEALIANAIDGRVSLPVYWTGVFELLKFAQHLPRKGVSETHINAVSIE